MNFLLTVCIHGEPCTNGLGFFDMLLGLIPVAILLLPIIFFTKRKQQKLEKNIKHWKQIGVNKPRRDFKG